MTRKELKEQYKNRKIIGGVYVIKNTGTDKILLCSTTDIKGSINWFSFAKQTNSCVDLALQKDWNRYGSEQFTFEVLEELEKEDSQTDSDFKKSLDILKEIWFEKLEGNDFYK